MYVNRNWNEPHYYCMFDEIPEITYEKVGCKYVGSATDRYGNIIFSDYLEYGSWGEAFAGREISLHMKDGTTQKIKDYWYDCGYYKEHGEFIDICGGTLESLQRCYVYSGYNINKATFQKMLDDYYSREKEYEYYQIEEWAKLQYKWYPVVIDGVQYPIMVNKYGDFVRRESKQCIYPRKNIVKYVRNKRFKLYLFEFEYNNGVRLSKIQRQLLDVLKESLPFTEKDIIENCKLNLL